ncbi:hypothetical protein KPH14_009909 [Odynerus spinipes]|uniref:Vitellogenin domain-containing protein n=1 Tax=Odynerus spinipes TaxID=1348599 RepID=A0AAD9RSL5_9HYME|nr:hypothetical protein KPH14_009909 [Odynerus spinipes]
MLLTIIPFFLAARFALDENYEERYRWRYGAESIFDVSVNLSRVDFGEGANPTTICSTITGELECRAKDSESLGCRLRNDVTVSSRVDDSSGCQQQSGNVVTTRDRIFDREPFEIRFNSHGVENLVVRRTIPRWRLDIIKAVVVQLDIGTELEKEPSSFVTTEDSSFGRCELDSKILVTGDRASESEFGSEFGSEFEIVSLASNGSRSADLLARYGTIIIEKVRRPEKCPGRVLYFFGYASNDDRSERGTFLDMVSSMTRTTISDTGFSSRTLSEGAIVTSDGSTIKRSSQRVTLTLKSVNPGRGMPLTISDPASTNLHVPSTFERYFHAARRIVRVLHQRKPFPRDRRSLFRFF